MHVMLRRKRQPSLHAMSGRHVQEMGSGVAHHFTSMGKSSLR